MVAAGMFSWVGMCVCGIVCMRTFMYKYVLCAMRDSLSYFYGRVNGINGISVFLVLENDVYDCFESFKHKWDKKPVFILGVKIYWV